MEATMNSVGTENIDYSDRSDEHVKGLFEGFVGSNLSKSKKSNSNVFGVLSRHNDMAVNGTVHDYIAKRSKEDWNKKQYGEK
jgi:hypothetical protein